MDAPTTCVFLFGKEGCS